MSVRVRPYTIRICDDCANLRGRECHEPGCVFCWKSIDEIRTMTAELLLRAGPDDKMDDKLFPADECDGPFHVKGEYDESTKTLWCQCREIASRIVGASVDPATWPPSPQEMDELLCHVAQLFDGWHADGTAWSAWDESVRQEVSRMHARAGAALNRGD